MKLGTIKNDSRDGRLIVVNRELSHYIFVPDIANTLQEALDQWNKKLPQLQMKYDALNDGKYIGLPFEEKNMCSPLPRAYQWADGSAYVNHVELVRKARGANLPESFWHDPLMYQGGSDTFLGPCDDIPLRDENDGLDFEAEVAVITTDVPLGVSSEEAGKYIALFMLVNDISLRNLIPKELEKGFGFFNGKPSSSFSPVAVSSDELGAAWDGKKLHLPLISYYNGKMFGCPNAGEDMTFDFPTLIAHAAKTRQLSAGTIIGSGTVSNKKKGVGSSCLAEKRMLEKIEQGEIITPFMKLKDVIRIEMFDGNHLSIFGGICQEVVPHPQVEE